MSLFKRKDSPYWWVKFTIHGRKVQTSSGTEDRKLAQEFHDRLKADCWKQVHLGHKPRRSWAEAVLRWLQETSHKATHHQDKGKLALLDDFLGSVMLDQIDSDLIDQIKRFLIKDRSRSTCNRYLALIRSILRCCVHDWEWLDDMPRIRLYKEPGGRVRSLSPEQAQRLLDELPDHQREMALFALATGLRQANVFKLRWEQVDLGRQHAWVDSKDSKTGVGIAVPLNSIAMDVLIRQKGKHATRVFTYQGKPLNSVNTKAWKKALERAEIEDFRWHDLRHTWATWQRAAGTPTHELQKLGGWKNGSMVERYAHLSSDHLVASAKRIEKMLPGYDLAT